MKRPTKASATTNAWVAAVPQSENCEISVNDVRLMTRDSTSLSMKDTGSAPRKSPVIIPVHRNRTANIAMTATIAPRVFTGLVP